MEGGVVGTVVRAVMSLPQTLRLVRLMRIRRLNRRRRRGLPGSLWASLLLREDSVHRSLRYLAFLARA